MTDYLKHVSKGWGFERWIVNKEAYCGKLLYFVKGKHCSWHYHEIKDETFYVQSGRLLVVHSDADCLIEDNRVAIRVIRRPPTSLGTVNSNDVDVSLQNWLLDVAYASVKEEDSAVGTIMEPGDVFYVKPGLRHAMYALQDTEMFEFSTEHFDEDSIRVLKGD